MYIMSQGPESRYVTPPPVLFSGFLESNSEELNVDAYRLIDPSYKTCIPDRDKKMSKEEKEEKFKEEKSKKRSQFKQKKYDKVKKEKRWRYEEREKRNKVRRLSRCLAIVPLVMGAEAAEEYGNEFFDEDYLESLALLDFWPEDEPIDSWINEDSDSLFESDWYLDMWVNHANGNMKVRGLDSEMGNNHTTPYFQPESHSRGSQEMTETRDLIVRDGHIQKRFWSKSHEFIFPSHLT